MCTRFWWEKPKCLKVFIDNSNITMVILIFSTKFLHNTLIMTRKTKVSFSLYFWIFRRFVTKFLLKKMQKSQVEN